MANTEFTRSELKYLERLAKEYPNIQAVSNEIINLESILKLPKGTELFMSDIHGEYEAFTHILNNASGVIREKVDTVLEKTLSSQERADFSTLIYYPTPKLQEVKRSNVNMQEWYRVNLYRLVEVCHLFASKSTRKYVRSCLPKGYEFLIDELLYAHYEEENKRDYYDRIISSIIETNQADNFIEALSVLIKRLAVRRLHIVGDVYDRGPRPDIIIDKLMQHHAVDLQWGNHDLLWMGAAAGSDICIANVMNVTVKFNNLEVLEDGYGINLRPLALFAEQMYGDDECAPFAPRILEKRNYNPQDIARVSKIHKAISIIMFKLECQAIDRNPDFEMEKRKLLLAIDYEKGTIVIDGVKHELLDTNFPTIDPQNPTALTEDEHEVMIGLRKSFMQSEKLNEHIRFFYNIGSMYKIENNNVLFHGAVPLEDNGSFAKVAFEGQEYHSVTLMDYCDKMARQAYDAPLGSPERQRGLDFLWYLWCGPKSPTFGRDKMTTFERLYIADKNTHKEEKDNYYRYIDSETVAKVILTAFGVDSARGHIINGHVPVQASNGEKPIKAGGKIIVIDGGFSKAYQPKTGIAGYTLVFSSRGISIRSHQPFESMQKAVAENIDIISTVYVFETASNRMLIENTDEGDELKGEIEDLHRLYTAYKEGYVKENMLFHF